MKLFVTEVGSISMLRFASAEADSNKVISAMTAIEACSAIWRLRQTRLFTAAQASLALTRLEHEVKRINQQAVGEDVLVSAAEMVKRHNLRALDAVQLASAIVARTLFDAPQMRFIASDYELLKAAEAENFTIWNPAA